MCEYQVCVRVCACEYQVCVCVSFPLHMQDTVPQMMYFEANIPKTLAGWEAEFAVPRGFSTKQQ